MDVCWEVCVVILNLATFPEVTEWLGIRSKVKVHFLRIGTIWHIHRIRSSFLESMSYSVQATTLKAEHVVVNKVTDIPFLGEFKF